MKHFKSYLLTAFVLTLFLATQADVALACPGCKQALATAEGEQANMVNGYFWSILFMMSMPFTLLGVFGGSMYLAIRKSRRQAQQAGKTSLTDHFSPDVAARLYGTSPGGQSV